MAADAARLFDELGAAVVGPGFIGRIHAEAIRRVGARVRIVVARTEGGAAEARDQCGAERATTDYAQALSDPEVDVVHICTPNSLHFSMATAAISAGKHVVLEKPLTITSTEGKKLVREAEASGLIHAICFNNRFYPMVQEIHEQVGRGDLGNVISVRASVLEDGLLYPSDWNWRLDPSLGGPSVALSTIGCHLIDLVSFMVGDVVSEVCADLNTVHPRRQPSSDLDRDVEVDGQEIAHLLVRFRKGYPGLLAVSQVAAGRRLEFSVEVDGTRRALAWEVPDPNELWVGNRDSPNQIIQRDSTLISERARGYTSYAPTFREGFVDGFKQLVAHVYTAIVDRTARAAGEALYPTFYDGLVALQVHEAALASAKSGRWEEVAY